MKQIVSITFFRFEGFKNRWWAFTQMGKKVFLNKERINIPKGILVNASGAWQEGATFMKMFGAGSGNGFNLMPDFGVYGLLAVWENEAAARLFFSQNEAFKSYQNRATEIFTVFLQPIMSHGKWDAVEPFETSGKNDPLAPVAVLTRGSIKTKYIYKFHRFTRTTSRSLEGAEGRIFSIGIGELPIVQQVTFSLWDNEEAMKNFAYKNPHHAVVIKKTRELGWYSEELFARFQVLSTEGSWKNLDLNHLNKLLKNNHKALIL